MLVNEKETPWREQLTLADLAREIKPDAEIAVLNGFPLLPEDWDKTPVGCEDTVTLLRQGEGPTAEDFRFLLEERHTPEVARPLAQAVVGIAGCGGLGSHAAYALARAGVGRLIVADLDVIEPSNLNRQAYRLCQIACPKAESLASDLAAVNPAVRVDYHCLRLTGENIPVIFADCDIVLECFDKPDQKRMLVETVLRELPRATVIAASGLAGTGDGNAIVARKIRDRFFLVGDGESAASSPRGLLAPRVMVAAGQQALLALRIILDEVKNA